jgi:uncharacterized small protein (DUF1192 family)
MGQRASGDSSDRGRLLHPMLQFPDGRMGRPFGSPGLQYALPSSLRHRRSLASGLMTIRELAERIDQRVAVLQQAIGRLEAAKKALAHSPGRPAVATETSEPPLASRRGRQAHSAGRAGRDPAPVQRGAQPAAARSLFRELDAGLRTRP